MAKTVPCRACQNSGLCRLFYRMADKDGKVQYFDDVYDRDSYVMKAFAITTKARSTSI